MVCSQALLSFLLQQRKHRTCFIHVARRDAFSRFPHLIHRRISKRGGCRFPMSGAPGDDGRPHQGEHNNTGVDKLRGYGRTIKTHILSNVGISSLMIGYAIVGALTFEALESPNEIRQRMHVRKLRKDCLHDLWKITNELNVLYESNWTHMVSKRLKVFEKSVVRAVRNDGYDGREEPTGELQWSFSGGLLYSITVITTIGYGTIGPKTTAGKIVTIFYALLGIPLMLLCLTNIGDIMAQSFAFTYSQLVNRLVGTNNKKKYMSTRQTPKVTATTMTSFPMKTSPSPDVLSKAEMTTVDVVIDSMKQDVQDNINLSEMEYELDITNKHGMDVEDFAYGDIDMDTNVDSAQESPLKSPVPNCYGPNQAMPMNCTIKSNSSQIVTGCGNVVKIDTMYHENGADTGGGRSSASEMRRVPILLVLVLVSGYVFAGAGLFSCWEGWTFVNGVYFCFTTLSTIGFGGLVPGTSYSLVDVHPGSQAITIICCLYFIVGLAIIAMSFNLVQEEIVILCKKLARIFGIIENEK